MDFSSSPFKNLKITILNNCSTDDTIQICNKFTDKFSDFNIITNKFNIGADANILRAVELVNSDYIWIVCDDDNYDFSYCDDLFDCIINEKADIINVGAHEEDEWKFGEKLKPVKEFIADGYPFFKAASFVPNNIFKVNKFIPHIIAGYKNITNMYPHMPYLISNYTENNLLYVTKNRIVSAGIGEQGYKQHELLKSWYHTSMLLKTEEDIKICFFNQWNANTKAAQLKLYRYFYKNSLKGIFYKETVLKILHLLPFKQKVFALLTMVQYNIKSIFK
jgi:glycosyltransferase involved in cell wall biosynthesis